MKSRFFGSISRGISRLEILVMIALIAIVATVAITRSQSTPPRSDFTIKTPSGPLNGNIGDTIRVTTRPGVTNPIHNIPNGDYQLGIKAVGVGEIRYFGLYQKSSPLVTWFTSDSEWESFGNDYSLILIPKGSKGPSPAGSGK